MKHSSRIYFQFLGALLALASFGAHAKYDGENRGKPVMPSQVNAKFQQECAGCHMAYPPGLLPATSWTKMMSGLDKHFGVDASLTPAEVTEISNFLTKNASNRWTASTAPLRITDSVWFKTKHNSREIPPDVWKRASVKSPSNCMACHSGADKGDFEEDRVRIPR
jgi:nitrate/TMAO reductase-like tetraheme cytochrome c subunit